MSITAGPPESRPWLESSLFFTNRHGQSTPPAFDTVGVVGLIPIAQRPAPAQSAGKLPTGQRNCGPAESGSTPGRSDGEPFRPSLYNVRRRRAQRPRTARFCVRRADDLCAGFQVHSGGAACDGLPRGLWSTSRRASEPSSLVTWPKWTTAAGMRRANRSDCSNA
jgi:hypothetical protein